MLMTSLARDADALGSIKVEVEEVEVSLRRNGIEENIFTMGAPSPISIQLKYSGSETRPDVYQIQGL